MDFLVVGGDRRSCLLADELQKHGYPVQSLGIHPEDEQTADPTKADVVLLPYPFSVKGGFVRSQSGMEIPFRRLLDALKPGATLFYHGNLEVADAGAFRWRLYDSESAFLQENSRISAEGAVSALMLATEDSLFNMHCLVTGYGIFGRALTKMLLSFGAKVTVTARRQEALQLAKQDGAAVLTLSQLEEAPKEWDAVLNTIPARVLEDSLLEKLPTQCLLLELASQPGGFCQQKAKELRLPVLNLPGIPGKYAPRAAAKALMQTVLSTLKELEI